MKISMFLRKLIRFEMRTRTIGGINEPVCERKEEESLGIPPID